MSTKILNTQVEMAPSGRVTISSEEFLSQALRPVMERFDKKVSGRMFLSKERSELVFEPYLVGKRMQKVRQK